MKDKISCLLISTQICIKFILPVPPYVILNHSQGNGNYLAMLGYSSNDMWLDNMLVVTIDSWLDILRSRSDWLRRSASSLESDLPIFKTGCQPRLYKLASYYFFIPGRLTNAGKGPLYWHGFTFFFKGIFMKWIQLPQPEFELTLLILFQVFLNC